MKNLISLIVMVGLWSNWFIIGSLTDLVLFIAGVWVVLNLSDKADYTLARRK